MLIKEEDIESVSLITHPILTLKTLAVIFKDLALTSLKFISRNLISVLVLATILVLPHLVSGPHSKFVAEIDDFMLFAGYWIILGVLSSIGFGTGLHTFVLYLGPHIAKVAMVAYSCNAIPEMLPSRWNFKQFGACPDAQIDQHISFWKVLAAVQLEGFLWGFGTAIGELPPYLVAKAARLSGSKDKELEELEHQKDDTLLTKAKRVIYSALQKHAFLTVLCCASIPNPLFDLAGITCGHFLIPFATFFIATAIGKSIIKVHIQMVSIILMFSGKTIITIINGISAVFPFLHDKLHAALKSQKEKLHLKKVSEDKHWIAQVWDYVILIMVAYFVLSIINSSVQNHLKSDLEAEKSKKKSKKD